MSRKLAVLGRARSRARVLTSSTAALGAAVLLAAAGVSQAGAQAAPDEHTTETALAYTCRFPSGSQQVGVHVAATFPASGAVGEPIQPSDVTATLTIPRDAVANLEADTVTATAGLATTVLHNDSRTKATWSSLTARPTLIPDSGQLALEASGTAPAMTVDEPGDVVVNAAGLQLTLTATATEEDTGSVSESPTAPAVESSEGTPSSTPTSTPDAAEDPAPLSASCTTSPNQDVTLATIPVSATGQAPNPPDDEAGPSSTPDESGTGNTANRHTQAAPSARQNAAASSSDYEQRYDDVPTQHVSTELTFACRFPAKTRLDDDTPPELRFETTARIEATVPVKVLNNPSTGSGQIWPTDVSTRATIPQAALDTIVPESATTTIARLRVSMTHIQNGESSGNIEWVEQGLSESLPSRGGLTLTAAPGTVNPIGADKPPNPLTINVRDHGHLTFAPHTLWIVLQPKQADGSPTDPSWLEVGCDPVPGQDLEFFTIPFPPPPGIPSDCGALSPFGIASSGCALLAGYANVNELDAAVQLGRGRDGTPKAALSNLDVGWQGANLQKTVQRCSPIFGCIDIQITSWQVSCTVGHFSYQGERQLPPARSTVLTFGFMPVTATATISEAPWPQEPAWPAGCLHAGSVDDEGPLLPPEDLPEPGPKVAIVSYGSGFRLGDYDDDLPDFQHQPQVTFAETYVTLRLHDVVVNGQHLDVGPHCRTTRPVHVRLTGHGYGYPGGSPPRPSGYDVYGGGILTGQQTIPPFTGCGVDEDLDALLTNQISGPHNAVRMGQGRSCFLSTYKGCAPTSLKPEEVRTLPDLHWPAETLPQPWCENGEPQPWATPGSCRRPEDESGG